jgi:hypothetical protein
LIWGMSQACTAAKANLTLSAPHARGFIGSPMKIRPRFAAEGVDITEGPTGK